MRTVYTHKREWWIYFLNGNVLKVDPYNRNFFHRACYQYGEKPENRIEEHCVKALDSKEEQVRIFEELIQKLDVKDGYHGHRTKFRKRLYLESGWFGKKIFMDELIGWEVRDTYQVVENPDMSFLQRDLRFNEYSQLIFDREQELRSMIGQNR